MGYGDADKNLCEGTEKLKQTVDTSTACVLHKTFQRHTICKAYTGERLDSQKWSERIITQLKTPQQ